MDMTLEMDVAAAPDIFFFQCKSRGVVDILQHLERCL